MIPIFSRHAVLFRTRSSVASSLTRRLCRRPPTQAAFNFYLCHSYATKNKLKSTASFVPGSKSPITDESARQEYGKCEAAMQASIDFFRKDCAVSENRALGRITPALLSPVKVKLPENPKGVKLEELATVGVREGSTLLITLYNEHVKFSLLFRICDQL